MRVCSLPSSKPPEGGRSNSILVGLTVEKIVEENLKLPLYLFCYNGKVYQTYMSYVIFLYMLIVLTFIFILFTCQKITERDITWDHVAAKKTFLT